MEQSVPKRRHINFRRRGITQKKAYNILVVVNKHNTARVASCWFIIYYTELMFLRVIPLFHCFHFPWGWHMSCTVWRQRIRLQKRRFCWHFSTSIVSKTENIVHTQTNLRWHVRNTFLAALTKLRKWTISRVMSVCLSVCARNYSVRTGQFLPEILISKFSLRYGEKFQVLVKICRHISTSH